ncbi:DUF4232 domain-containing protein [Streptomyces sp. ME02-6979-3A]|uniref:DUF4232 domain-containing protein n=1 Tax=Streptomyces silvae TaxID=2803812 RepID=A0ABU8A3F6_9ACTN|nr:MULTISPECIES: DUF4232 domain-containing protein [unclassified Streptomyces]WSS66517.1 DUF4232 domain-containing protein [Streptomyces sp. NBC_01177]WSS73465.1 DUF4232 domain-containing protein [Streptomyces sp. NBC_01175]WSS81007.1 DUF4232 domain-containing protein [Streptomyces sp. NBC_01174]MDX3326912.1 DUF4232 domain-containing protein [Streptomyces sp. ME02-6979-3A]RPK39940.1 hypothetical protein EES40_23820 [Streptomyces sp. ADI93-02]
MRSRLAARSARLVLAAAAVTALAATSTACSPDDVEDTGSSPAASASAGKTDSPSAGESVSASASGSGGSDSGTDAKTEAAGDGDKSGYGQSCGTNDLDFKVTSETQAGGYYLVTAKAKSGITCYLDVNTPSVSFGSGDEGLASPVGQGGEDPIKLTGSAVAYTGISPKTTNTDGGVEFENVIISVTNDDPNPAELKLPDTATVDKPIVTNWATDRAEAVPVIV